MTALVIPDYPLTRKMLLQDNLDIDYFETTSHLISSEVKQFSKQALLIHNSVANLSLAHPDALNYETLAWTQTAVNQTKTPWLSVHLGFSAIEVEYNGQLTQAHSPPLSRDHLFDVLCNNLVKLAKEISIPLIVENLDYNSGGAYEHICHPDFITAVVEECNVDLLWDIAHAQVSAAQMGYSITDYIGSLPLNRVMQMHISGPRWRNDTLTDAHEPLREEDYALLMNVLEVTNPCAVTLEYFRDENLLTEQIERLRIALESFDGNF
jgi:uncharacterized protein